MKISKKLFLSLLSASILCEMPMVGAVKTHDRMNERIRYPSSFSAFVAVNGPESFRTSDKITAAVDAQITAEKDPKKQNTKATVMWSTVESDVLRAVALFKFRHSIPEVDSKAYVSEDDLSHHIEKSDTDTIPDTFQITKQSESYARFGKVTAQQLAANITETTGDRAYAIGCANAQYVGGRIATSTSQEEELDRSLCGSGIETLTGKHEEPMKYYGNGRDTVEKGGEKAYNPRNACVLRNVSFFKDSCFLPIMGFHRGVCERLHSDPSNELKIDDIAQTNIILHAAPDYAQASDVETFEKYIEQEFTHLIEVALSENRDKKGTIHLVVPMFGTGSYTAGAMREAAKEAWLRQFRIASYYASKLGVELILADYAPSTSAPFSADDLEKHKETALRMFERVSSKITPLIEQDAARYVGQQARSATYNWGL